MEKTKNTLAIVGLVVGTFLLLEGAYPVHEILVGGVMIAIGGALFLSYFWLIGDFIERWLGGRWYTFLPPLLVLGFVMLVFGLIKPLPTGSKLLFAVPGFVLVLTPGCILWKRSRGRVSYRLKRIKKARASSSRSSRFS